MKGGFVTTLTVGGAFAAYCIGAGFATGQESLQFYGSYGGYWPFILLGVTAVLMFFFCLGTYKAGSEGRVEDPNATYMFFCGKGLGRVLDIFCTFSIAASTLIMFAGSGATINQYLGLPVWVGTLIMGIVSVVVVCFGLEKVTNVLGFVGTLIIIMLLFTGIYTFATADTGLMDAQKNVLKYVEEGTILQGSFMGLDNPVLANIYLVGAYITLGVVFNTTLGTRCADKKQVVGGAICSVAFFIIGDAMVLFSMLLNLDYIGETKASVPMLAAIENTIPSLAMPFSIVIVLGVFTTVTGYLWAVGRRFAPDRTKKQAIVVIIMAAIGVTIASVIPLANLVNTIYPLIGIAGVIILIGVIYRTIADKAKPAASTSAE